MENRFNTQLEKDRFQHFMEQKIKMAQAIAAHKANRLKINLTTWNSPESYCARMGLVGFAISTYCEGGKLLDN